MMPHTIEKGRANIDEKAVHHDCRTAQIGDTFTGFLVLHSMFGKSELVCNAEGEMFCNAPCGMCAPCRSLNFDVLLICT